MTAPVTRLVVTSDGAAVGHDPADRTRTEASRWTRPSLRTSAVIAMLALTLTGCGGDAGTPDTGTPTSTQSPAADGSSTPRPVSTEGSGGSPTPSSEASSGEFVPASSEGPAQNVPVPEMPDEAREQTKEGLEAALEYWWEAEAYLKATGDKSVLDEVSSSDCGLCVGLMDRWTKIYELGGWAENGPATVTVQFISVDGGHQSGTGSMLVSESTSQIYQPDGSLGGSGDGSEERPWVFSATYEDEHSAWTMNDLEPQG